jgi:dipeptidyl aminopeptidase/acylaminoacyl peptidase
VRANATKYGVRPERIGAFGHSAGAQLAALLGMEDTPHSSDLALGQYSSKVQAVVDVSGPTDFTVHQDADSLAFLTSFLGDSPRDRIAASPALVASKATSPFLIVHGTRDDNVPISQAKELYAKLQQLGVPAKFVQVDDVHTFQTPEARRTLAIETVAFFNRYLVEAP